MFLRKLTIENSGENIREILFHKGFNLIIDETPLGVNAPISGNNVGKTTLLRLVDFCLGGEGKNIYKDTEFKNQGNTNIQSFLEENNICISLTLKDDLDVEDSFEVEIRRNFLSYGQKIQTVNGESITNNKQFQKKLSELIFKTDVDKPSFRQIVSKNIRDEKNKLVNTVKVLHPTTRVEEYEALFLFWFGIDTNQAKRKDELIRRKSLEKKLQERLRKEHTLSQVTQSLIIIERTIDELNQKKSSFNLNDNFNAELNKLNEAKANINGKSSELGRLEIRKTLILESKQDLEKEKTNVDTDQIKALYQRAKVFIPSIQKTFEETVRFHNNMVADKLSYITKELPDIEKRIIEIKDELSFLLKEEKSLSVKLNKSGAIEDLQNIISDLNKEFEKKGRLEELKRLWEGSTKKIDEIDKELGIINDGILSKDELFQARIAEFNKYFSDISFQLYGERFVLSADPTERAYELNITSIEGNLGTGKKKGQIAAFDLAYIQFADEIHIPCLHFVMHDQIENIDDNQLNTLIDISNGINGQYIAPILRDKVPANINIDSYAVIRLSQTDKLFRLP